MQTLQFEDMIRTVEEKYKFDHRNFKKTAYGKTFNMDFWRWLFNAFNFLEDERFSEDEHDLHTFVLNFDDKIKIQQKEHKDLTTLLAKFDNKFSPFIIKLFSFITKEKIELDMQRIKEATKETDLDDLQSTPHYVIYMNFFRALKDNNDDIERSMVESDPSWIIEIINYIDSVWGHCKDKDGAYHLKFYYD